jgi:glycosyltransferase involved in cell wall biosynthesis
VTTISIESDKRSANEEQECLPENIRQEIFIVMPAFNEATTVRSVVKELTGLYPHVIVVDDGSSDDTSSKALSSGATLLRHPVNLGQGAALQTGIEYSLLAGAQVIVTLDADGQHYVRDVARLVTPILKGKADIVLGSRFLGQAIDIHLSRRILLKGGILFTRLVSGVSLTDVHNGLRAFSRRAAKKIHIKINRMAHASELIDQIKRSNYPYVEVPVRLRYTDYTRRKGQKSLDVFRIVADYVLGRIIR